MDCELARERLTVALRPEMAVASGACLGER
jgi:hypothetical protein